ncbi:lipoprotein-releasing ABC transporter permease subunit [Aliidiomarina celeris]|uniref:lipoprotein-releasing ABC transporter permease subunit n=1 Tax=Aliidiomarina celeris TaxID=2249428 RepID=UPI000DEA69DA|nr:lipoprotein-releasing ABC transporter permease subunit [Aliidiomarina celeris]
MNLAFTLASRFRKNKATSGYLSFIARSSTWGIGLGCAILIILLSVMNGFHKALEDDLLSLVPHVEFEAVSGGLANWQGVVATAEQHAGVVAAAPVTRFVAMAQQQQRFFGMDVRAILPAEEARVSDLQRYTPEADWQRFVNAPQGILLGQGLAQELNVSVGDTLTLFVPQLAPQDRLNGAPKRARFTVEGIFQFGGELDFKQAYVHLAQGRELTGLNTESNAVRLRLYDVYSAPWVANEIAAEIDEYAYIHDWTRTEGHLYRDIQLVKTVMYIVLVLVLAVASFNIVATLMMQVEEKRGSIAILKTMGASDTTIIRTFMWQGALNGIPGTLIGCLVGVIGAWFLPSLFSAVEALLGHSLLAADIYFVSTVPVQVQWADVVWVGLIALVSSLLATIYPAYRAAQVAPVIALRQL